MDMQTNELLTRTGPGTPCGEMMRRYWIPAGISDDLTYLPQAVKLLGEDLVLFRDGQGRPGLLGIHCSHRGASLEFGQVDEEGIRCCYHGWLYDVDGNVLDMPAEPPESKAKEHIRHLAYPCRELGGLVFTYMGPLEKMPELPGYEGLVREDGTREVSAAVQDYNWLQAIENTGDPVHTAILHAIPGRRNINPKFFDIPRFEATRTDRGMVIHQVRSTFHQQEEIIMPRLQIHRSHLTDRNADLKGPQPVATQMNWNIPMDDTHHWDVLLVFTPFDEDGKPRETRSHRLAGYARRDRPYEARQRGPDDTEAVQSQGPIARREDWNLVSSDTGIILFERVAQEAIEAVQQGNDPPGIIRDLESAKLVEAAPWLTYEPPETPLESWRTQGLRVWSKRVGPVTTYDSNEDGRLDGDDVSSR